FFHWTVDDLSIVQGVGIGFFDHCALVLSRVERECISEDGFEDFGDMAFADVTRGEIDDSVRGGEVFESGAGRADSAVLPRDDEIGRVIWVSRDPISQSVANLIERGMRPGFVWECQDHFYPKTIANQRGNKQKLTLHDQEEYLGVI